MEEMNIMNEEVIENAEEIVNATSGNGLKKVTTFGLGMVVGALAYRFVVKPGVEKIKIWHRNRKAEAGGLNENDDVVTTIEDDEE